MDPNKVAVIIGQHVPTNITALRAFLGLLGYYQSFIELYFLTTGPMMTNLLQD